MTTPLCKKCVPPQSSGTGVYQGSLPPRSIDNSKCGVEDWKPPNFFLGWQQSISHLRMSTSFSQPSGGSIFLIFGFLTKLAEFEMCCVVIVEHALLSFNPVSLRMTMSLPVQQGTPLTRALTQHIGVDPFECLSPLIPLAMRIREAFRGGRTKEAENLIMEMFQEHGGIITGHLKSEIVQSSAAGRHLLSMLVGAFHFLESDSADVASKHVDFQGGHLPVTGLFDWPESFDFPSSIAQALDQEALAVSFTPSNRSVSRKPQSRSHLKSKSNDTTQLPVRGPRHQSHPPIESIQGDLQQADDDRGMHSGFLVIVNAKKRPREDGMTHSASQHPVHPQQIRRSQSDEDEEDKVAHELQQGGLEVAEDTRESPVEEGRVAGDAGKGGEAEVAEDGLKEEEGDLGSEREKESRPNKRVRLEPVMKRPNTRSTVKPPPTSATKKHDLRPRTHKPASLPTQGSSKTGTNRRQRLISQTKANTAPGTKRKTTLEPLEQQASLSVPPKETTPATHAHSTNAAPASTRPPTPANRSPSVTKTYLGRRKATQSPGGLSTSPAHIAPRIDLMGAMTHSKSTEDVPKEAPPDRRGASPPATESIVYNGPAVSKEGSPMADGSNTGPPTDLHLPHKASTKGCRDPCMGCLLDPASCIPVDSGSQCQPCVITNATCTWDPEVDVKALLLKQAALTAGGETSDIGNRTAIDEALEIAMELREVIVYTHRMQTFMSDQLTTSQQARAKLNQLYRGQSPLHPSKLLTYKRHHFPSLTRTILPVDDGLRGPVHAVTRVFPIPVITCPKAGHAPFQRNGPSPVIPRDISSPHLPSLYAFVFTDNVLQQDEEGFGGQARRGRISPSIQPLPQREGVVHPLRSVPSLRFQAKPTGITSSVPASGSSPSRPIEVAHYAVVPIPPPRRPYPHHPSFPSAKLIDGFPYPTLERNGSLSRSDVTGEVGLP
ncbi:hypothetical protein NMY22_g10138 [Coprinellus aureogranulatus]|nr:hypothetical protein NMY22_g10138 [Coprinellus aureogranulatus]